MFGLGGKKKDSPQQLISEVPDDVPRFPQGYEARLRIKFAGNARFGRVVAWFRHDVDALEPPLAFVEDARVRQVGKKGSVVLSHFVKSDQLRGSYTLAGVTVTYLFGKKDGKELPARDVPPIKLVVTDRKGGEGKPDDKAPRVTEVSWE